MIITIFDLDNTISNDGWRIPFIDWSKENPAERYHEYHMLSSFDKFGNYEFVKMSAGQIVIFTARPCAYRNITKSWLHKHGLSDAILVMRDDDDHSNSVELKRNMLKEFRELFYMAEIVKAYDDRPEVTAMYREEGIHGAETISIHNVCAYTKPIIDEEKRQI